MDVPSSTALKSPSTADVSSFRATANTATLPPIPSKTGTVTVNGNTMTDAQKAAAGALRIDASAPPTTYDGMYVGSDGYAYPPEKFNVTEVPPFQPTNPVSNPPPTTYFTNGINTPPLGAMTGAQDLANHTGTNVVPIYNATEGMGIDVLQTGLDRIGLGSNKAANTLADAISADLDAGRQVNVVGYSQGGAVVSHALQMVDQRIRDANGGWLGNLPVIGDDNRRARESMLSNVNVVGIASAGKDFPAGPQYNFYVNQQDPVPNWLGAHEPNLIPDAVTNALAATSPLFAFINGGGAGFNAPGAQIHTFDDPAQGGFTPHDLNTYFEHIQSQ
ncbi:PE-PPE domain-containing protein [Hyalangium sp.]|uniref:PE-PPE domain-containing protein n=1 Tax=Hyalangium sp. TaxID=2028555 RepID=UPI002D41E1A3|nr:PE-PPE domain-containing protein [Hyalangium sp.]HYI00001.1 PE-PPE domain-containing protein [Hyalangium sp.]